MTQTANMHDACHACHTATGCGLPEQAKPEMEPLSLDEIQQRGWSLTTRTVETDDYSVWGLGGDQMTRTSQRLFGNRYSQ